MTINEFKFFYVSITSERVRPHSNTPCDGLLNPIGLTTLHLLELCIILV